uniref:Uncharacterized protein n=1 Tax=Anguilla anguilla TaxID=7936 RepID=A0A0E9VPB3_ANGAN
MHCGESSNSNNLTENVRIFWVKN